MNQTIEKTTLNNLVFNEDYCRKVLPFIKPDYFDIKEEKVVFEEIIKFVDKYKKIPTKTSLEIEIEHRKDLTEVEHDHRPLHCSFKSTSIPTESPKTSRKTLVFLSFSISSKFIPSKELSFFSWTFHPLRSFHFLDTKDIYSGLSVDTDPIFLSSNFSK